MNSLKNKWMVENKEIKSQKKAYVKYVTDATDAKRHY